MHFANLYHSRTLGLQILEYCNHHRGGPKPTDTSSEGHQMASPGPVADEWDKEFIKNESQLLFKLIIAANYLNIKSLVSVFCLANVDGICVMCDAECDFSDLGCRQVAELRNGKTPEYIRKMFNIVNSVTDKS